MPRVLLCHNPVYFPEAAGEVALQLSGHTHGGQIRFPFVPPLFLPRFGRIYVEGMFRLGNTQMYVNRGIGAVGIPVRLNCRPALRCLIVRFLESQP